MELDLKKKSLPNEEMWSDWWLQKENDDTQFGKFIPGLVLDSVA